MLVLCLALGLQADPPKLPAPQEAVEAEPPSPLRGSVAFRYRFRQTKGIEDDDLYELLQLRWADPEADPVSASLSVRFAQDVDRPDPGSAFASLDDAYGAATGRVYAAYVDVHPAGWNLRFRGGRQAIDELPEALPLDGGLLRLTAPVDVAVFAGVPVNLFESSPRGDLCYGGWAAGAPWTRGRLRADYLHLEDENLFGDFDDDLIGATFEQGAGAWFLSVRHTWLEREGREAVARLSGAFPEAGFAVDLRSRFAYERQQALSYALDPYATFLYDVEPYLELTARASQAFGGSFSLDASITQRRLTQDGEEGAYNHEFTRWTLAPRLEGWPWEELAVAASFDFWESDADDFWTAGGDLTLRLHARVALGAGSSYALYTIDALTGEERERVRTLHGSLRWTFDSGTRLTLRVAHEENDLGNWRILELGVVHAF